MWVRADSVSRRRRSAHADVGVAREIRYADSDGVQIAYEVFGAGPRDLVFVHGWVTNLELLWEHQRVARFSSVWDRSAGSSTSTSGARACRTASPSISCRRSSSGWTTRAVMDAAGCERAVLFGHSEGGPMCDRNSPRADIERVPRVLLSYGAEVERWLETQRLIRSEPRDEPWGVEALQRLMGHSKMETDRDLSAPAQSRASDGARARPVLGSPVRP